MTCALPLLTPFPFFLPSLSSPYPFSYGFLELEGDPLRMHVPKKFSCTLPMVPSPFTANAWMSCYILVRPSQCAYALMQSKTMARAKQLERLNANSGDHSMSRVSDPQLSSPTPSWVAPRIISVCLLFRSLSKSKYVNPGFCAETWLPSVSSSKIKYFAILMPRIHALNRLVFDRLLNYQSNSVSLNNCSLMVITDFIGVIRHTLDRLRGSV